MDELQILADASIPCVEEAFGRFGPVHVKPGRDIVSSDVAVADVLLVRSVTRVGPELLEGSSLHFVGSATIGTDHVDLAYLRARDIPFAHAPGSNADSVADYVLVALLTLACRREIALQDRTVGIVGCGNIGGRLVRRLQALGITVLRNDPPRARAAEEEGRPHEFVSLGTVLTEADIITLHVPLTTDGPDSTHHLVDAAFLERMNDGAWLLNTSRGAVVHGEALRRARRQGSLAAAVLDVWEHEPVPDAPLVRAVDVATPHIAGYAYDGKVRGTAMLYQAMCEQMGVEPIWEATTTLQPLTDDALRCRPPDPRLPTVDWLSNLAQQAYDVQADDAALRAVVANRPPEARAHKFSQLRTGYRRRRELQRHTVPRTAVPSKYLQAVEEGLTIQPG